MSGVRPRALLLSAYAAASHRYWARGLMHHCAAFDWTLLELAPRHFQWRVRGNPLSWMSEHDATLSQPFDLVVATSLVDLATLVGLYPHLGRARRVVYFHENQFAYPLGEHQKPRIEPLMVNLYSALAADDVVFNSGWNRDTFLDGVRAFLRRMPERVSPARLEALAANSRVLPVGLEAPRADTAAPRSGPPCIVWNHRWEYDKDPETFFAALERLSERGVDFGLAVMGQAFRRSPAVFERARERLYRHMRCFGHQSRDDYLAMLQQATLVVSTARHEFQGLAVMEAVQHGCTPLVPSRLCYPEFYTADYRYDGSLEELTERLAQWLTDPASRPPPPDWRPWCWEALAARYHEVLMP